MDKAYANRLSASVCLSLSVCLLSFCILSLRLPSLPPSLLSSSACRGTGDMYTARMNATLYLLRGMPPDGDHVAQCLSPSSHPHPVLATRATCDRFAEEVCKADAPFAAELFFSLLSVIATYDPVGWGVPYAGSFTTDLPARQLEMSAQV